jgi:hypothetical protein
LQIDADPIPEPAYHFDADAVPDPDFYLIRIRILFDPDTDFYLMRIHVTKMMRIRIHNTV